MMIVKMTLMIRVCVALLAPAALQAAQAPRPAEPVLTAAGEQLCAQFTTLQLGLRADIEHALPVVDPQKKLAVEKARAALAAAGQKAASSGAAADATSNIQAKIQNWRKYWIGEATQNIKKAQAALSAAANDAQREAAKKDLAKWEANKADGEKAIAQAEAEVEQAKSGQAALTQANQNAQAALAQARLMESNAVHALLADLAPTLASDRLDRKLVRCVALTEATPRKLAAFAQQSADRQALVTKFLADDVLLKEMLEAGGASGGRYAEACEIFGAIQKVSPKAREGLFRRLALATSLEHAVPVNQQNAAAETNAPQFVDPVKRYLHYEQAFLAGELDPAFKDFTTWEYRMVVDVDVPDAILAWGREMLRTYRPDHVLNPDYGWRYTMSVRTDVRYGSQDVGKDLPGLNPYQNIPLNGGVCGRRAFFGRFIAKSFGLPVWGVTQHKHAALSHWTPKGWVINLGAGFNASWWDKDDAPRSGPDFLLETQARERGREFDRVLRARWVSCALGETAWNDRRKVEGGFWSNVARYESMVLAATAVAQGPLGEELAEANESPAKLPAPMLPADTNSPGPSLRSDGSILLPAVAHAQPAGPRTVMKSFSGGMQMHCGGGFKARFEFEAPQEGAYRLTARVATMQDGQKLLITGNSAKAAVEVAVPFTVGLWQQTRPVEIALVKGRNTMSLELPAGTRGVTLKDFTLEPVHPVSKSAP